MGYSADKIYLITAEFYEQDGHGYSTVCATASQEAAESFVSDLESRLALTRSEMKKWLTENPMPPWSFQMTEQELVEQQTWHTNKVGRMNQLKDVWQLDFMSQEYDPGREEEQPDFHITEVDLV